MRRYYDRIFSRYKDSQTLIKMHKHHDSNFKIAIFLREQNFSFETVKSKGQNLFLRVFKKWRG
jgi:hypothetical protein